MKKSFLYFVWKQETQEIKIGQSTRVKERFTQLEVDEGTRLQLLVLLPQPVPVEKLLHYKFSHLRSRKDEWFRLGPDLIDLIETYSEHRYKGGRWIADLRLIEAEQRVETVADIVRDLRMKARMSQLDLSLLSLQLASEGVVETGLHQQHLSRIETKDNCCPYPKTLLILSVVLHKGLALNGIESDYESIYSALRKARAAMMALKEAA